MINKFFLELLLLLLLKFNSKLFSSFSDAVTKPTLAKVFFLRFIWFVASLQSLLDEANDTKMRDEIRTVARYQWIVLAPMCLLTVSVSAVMGLITRFEWKNVDQKIRSYRWMFPFCDLCVPCFTLFNTLAKCDNSQGNVGRSEF